MDDETQLFKKITSAFDTPAYMRRARQVEDDWSQLLVGCRRERMRLLEMPRLRLARFMALSRPWAQNPAAICALAEFLYLSELDRDWQTKLRTVVQPARSESQARKGLQLTADSFANFNRRWSEFVSGLDLSTANRARELYNQYYLIEKECALRSYRTAQQGFVPLKPIGASDLLQEFPLLRIPAANDK